MYRLAVGVEAGGVAALCMVCPLQRTEPHPTLYVILWENDPRLRETRRGGLLRLCREHLDELSRLMLDVF